MNASDAREFLKAQTWVVEGQTYRIMWAEREGIVKKLKDAFDILKMGYCGDFLGIVDCDRDKYCNINVHIYQFQRAEINPVELKLGEKTEAPTPTKKSRKKLD